MCLTSRFLSVSDTSVIYKYHSIEKKSRRNICLWHCLSCRHMDNNLILLNVLYAELSSILGTRILREPAYMFVVIYIKDLGFSVLISSVLLIVHLFLAPLIIWIHFHIIGTPVSYIIVSKGFVWKMDLQQANLYFDNSFILTDFVGWKGIVLITCQYS